MWGLRGACLTVHSHWGTGKGCVPMIWTLGLSAVGQVLNARSKVSNCNWRERPRVNKLEGSAVTVRVNWRELMNVIVGRCKG